MTKILHQIKRVILRPRRLFRELTLTNAAPLAVWIAAITLGSMLMSLWASHHTVYARNFDAFIALASVYILVFLSGIAVFAAVWHLTADMVGGAGRGLTLFYFILISTIPLWIAGPAAWVLQIVFALKGIYTILLILLTAWMLGLLIQAFSQLYRFSAARSALVIFLPVLLFSLIATAIVYSVPEQLYLPW